MTIVRIRPHHLICNLCFTGKGYNKKFVKNFSSIHNILMEHSAIIKIIAGCDDICKECPYNRNNQCTQWSIVDKLDEDYSTILKLKTDQTMSSQDMATKIKVWLTVSLFQKTCRQCSWYPMAICTPIIENYLFK